ncbi:MAG: hypothetical protein VX684_06500 [Planctomycetota bacterium]|nr:hypothetical protein [Planctomycetota bacterium]
MFHTSFFKALTPARNPFLVLAATVGFVGLSEGVLTEDLSLTQEASAQQGPPRGERGEGRDGGRGERGGEGRRGEGRGGEGRGGRGGGRRGGWGGGPGMQQIREQLEPDFMRRDIPIFVTQLQLDDTQEIILETIFEDYELDYEGRSDEVQDSMRTLGREMFQQMMPGNMQDRMGQAWREIREELSQRAAEQGGEISDAERRDFIRARMEQVQMEIESERAEQGLTQQGNPAASALFELFRGWMVEKAQMRDRFINDFKAQLSEDQLAMWPAFNRFLVREKSLPRARLSGENANLFLIIDEEGMSPESMARIEPMFDEYELALHEALTSRDGYLETSAPKLYEALEDQDVDRAKQIVERQVSYRKSVRDVNERYIEMFAAELADGDPAASAALKQSMMQEAYEEVYGPTRVTRAFEAAARMELDDDVMAAVLDLQVAYLSELAAQNDRILVVLRKEEPKRQLAEVDRINGFLQGNFMMGGRWSNDDPVRDAYEKRGELDSVYYERLSAVLTPEQLEELPGRRGRRGEWGGDRGERGERGGRGDREGRGGRGGRDRGDRDA